MKRYHSSYAVSEILGTMLLLIMSISVLSYVYYTVLTDDGPNEFVNTDINSFIEGYDIILEHRGGHPLSIDTEISLTIGSNDATIIVGDYLTEQEKSDSEWNAGERIKYPVTNLYQFNCMYGNPALDFYVEEINEIPSGNEPTLNEILKTYNGPTNISRLEASDQISNGSVYTEFRAVDPVKNMITFQGPLETSHLLDYQEWTLTDNLNSIWLRFEYVAGKGSRNNSLLYYLDRNESSSKIIYQMNNKNSDEGDIYNKNITVQYNESIGFGILSFKDYSDYYSWFTNIPMNSNNAKQAIIYDLGKTTLGPMGSYLIGFEDLDRTGGSSDDDFQDLVVIIHVVDCS